MSVFNNSSELKRGTLNPTFQERIHVEYTSGVKVWETPSVAIRAINNGHAVLIKTDGTKLPEKNKDG